MSSLSRVDFSKQRQSDSPAFHIIEAFAGLDGNRKMLICDRLFAEGYDSYKKMVQLLWPEASARDEKKLERFLILLKNTSH